MVCCCKASVICVLLGWFGIKFGVFKFWFVFVVMLVGLSLGVLFLRFVLGCGNCLFCYFALIVNWFWLAVGEVLLFMLVTFDVCCGI